MFQVLMPGYWPTFGIDINAFILQKIIYFDYLTKWNQFNIPQPD